MNDSDATFRSNVYSILILLLYLKPKQKSLYCIKKSSLCCYQFIFSSFHKPAFTHRLVHHLSVPNYKCFRLFQNLQVIAILFNRMKAITFLWSWKSISLKSRDHPFIFNTTTSCDCLIQHCYRNEELMRFKKCYHACVAFL